LESITFKDSPASFSVGSEAFYNCTKLSGFQASANSIVITSIGEYAFYNCSSLTFDGLNAITSVEGNKTTKIINGSNGIAFKSDDNLTIKGCLITGDCDLSNQN
jgi:hypothetical protein